jgi:hypothetical protein
MPRPSLLTLEQKMQLRRYALATQKRGHYVHRPNTSELCTYVAREFGVRYGERGMAKNHGGARPRVGAQHQRLARAAPMNRSTS